MASFTDTQMPRFNPYIAQQPVKEMAEVGEQKQKSYEEGVQKIQTQIDNIAGLDVIRDVDRAHLQSKLNQLGNNLRIVAAGDFSNFQLVNSVSGMTKQVVRDKDVQNAVTSTAKYRKEAALAADALKEGKSSIANQWDFHTGSSKWLNSKDLKESYGHSYTPYTDVDKKWFEVVKSLHPSLREEDIAYERNPDGSLNKEKTLAAMERKSKETVSAPQIENALRASLSPDDINQLNINGRYEFRGSTPDQLKQYSVNKYNEAVDRTNLQIEQFKGLANMSASDPDAKKKYMDAADALEASKDGLRETYFNSVKTAQENPEVAKGYIYKEGAIKEFSNAHSWETRKLNLLTNPVGEREQADKNYALAVDARRLAAEQFSWKQHVDTAYMNRADAYLKIAEDKAFKELHPTAGPGVVYGGENTNIKEPVTAFQNETQDNMAAKQKFINELAEEKGVTPAVAQQFYDAYCNGDTTKIPKDWQDDANSVRQGELAAISNQAVMKKAMADTEKDLSSDPEYVKAKTYINSKINLNLEGTKIQMSPKELVDYKYKAGRNQYDFEGHRISPTEGMTPKEKSLYAFTQNPNSSRSTISQLNHIIEQNKDKFESTGRTALEKRDALYKTKLSSKLGGYIPAQYDIVVSKPAEVAQMANIASSAIDVYLPRLAGMKLGDSSLGTSQEDLNKAKAWMTGPGRSSILYKKVVQGGKNYLAITGPTKAGATGTEEVLVPLTAETYRQLPKGEAEPDAMDLQVMTALQKGGGNTNVTGDPTKGFYQKYNMPNVKRLTATADLQQKRSDKNLNYINLNIKLPSGWHNLQLDDHPVSVSDANTYINTVLTDKEILMRYLKDPRVSDKVKQEILNLK